MVPGNQMGYWKAHPYESKLAQAAQDAPESTRGAMVDGRRVYTEKIMPAPIEPIRELHNIMFGTYWQDVTGRLLHPPSTKYKLHKAGESEWYWIKAMEEA